MCLGKYSRATSVSQEHICWKRTVEAIILSRLMDVDDVFL